jgi:catechol 2,3-dioxygenase-like lactoylglutathione lyase family enzyme
MTKAMDTLGNEGLMFKGTRAFSSFSVDDMKKAKAFYSDTLGLDVNEIPEGIELHLAGGGIPVFIYHSTDYRVPEHTVLNFMVDDIDAAVDQLGMRGVHMEYYDLPEMKTDAKGILRNDSGGVGPKAIAWFKDPAGHILSVLQEE